MLMLVNQGPLKGKLVEVLLFKYGFAIISCGGGHGAGVDLVPDHFLETCA